jgi:hypothetical protein
MAFTKGVGFSKEGAFFEECGGAFFDELIFVFPREAGKNEDRDVGGGGIGFEFLQNFGAAELGQEHIEYDEVGKLGGGLGDGLFAITGRNDLVRGFGEGRSVAILRNLLSSTSKDGFHRSLNWSV